jgi:hypothetical protein
MHKDKRSKKQLTAIHLYRSISLNIMKTIVHLMMADGII